MRLIALVCLLTPYSLLGAGSIQYPQLDQWKEEVASAHSTQDSLYPMLKLARHYVEIDRDKAENILQWTHRQGFAKTSKERAEWHVVKGLIKVKDLNFLEAVPHYEQAITLYQRKDRYREVARTRFCLMEVYLNVEDSASARKHWEMAREILLGHGERERLYYLQLQNFEEFLFASEYETTQDAIRGILPTLRKIGDPWMMARAHQVYSSYFKFRNEYSKALNVLDSALHYLNKVSQHSFFNQQKLYCHVYYLRGWNYRYKSEYDSAIFAFKKGIAHGEKSGNQEFYSHNLKGLGNIYEIQKNYDRAYTLLLESMELDKQRQDLQQVAWNLNAIGNIHEGKGNYQKALNNYKRSVYLNDSIGLGGYPAFERDLAGIYLHFNETDSAIHTLLRSQSLQAFLDNPQPEQILYLGDIYVADRQYKKAFSCYQEILERANMPEKLRMDARALMGIAGIYLEAPAQVSKADLGAIGTSSHEIVFRQAYEKAQAAGLVELMAQSARLLADYYKHSGQADKAIRYMEKYVTYHDSLIALKSEQTLESLEAKHQIKEKENEIALLEKEQKLNRLELQNAREARQKNLLLWVGSVLILLIAGGGLFARYRYIEREKRRRIREREAIKIEAQKKLEQSKSQFFANMTHEFKTPIALLQSPLQKLLEEESNTTKREYLKIMQRNSDRMLQLTNQLLDINKLENRSLELHPHYGDLVGFLTRLSKDFLIFAEQKGLRFDLDLPSHPVEAVFDSERLEIVFFNLLSNAIKFTEKGGHVGVRMEMVKDNKVQVAITDTGTGIPAESQPQVFDRFYQGDQQRHGSGGTGLGLAISRELVQLHKGAIALQSQPGEGSTFTVTLPLFALEVDSPKAEKEQTATTSKIQSLAKRKHRILVIDDNDDLRRVLKHLLSPGYKVLTAKDGKEGLDRALQEIPDLIISDIMMPGMDGMEMLSTIRNDDRTSHVPFIFLTAKGRMQQKLKGLEIGADDYLAKPFNNDEVLLKVQNLLQRVDQLRERFQQVSITPRKPASQLSREEQFIQKVIDIIHSNLADAAFSVDALSEQVHMSRSQLYRKLQAITGKGPKTFIREVRLKKAHELLKRGDQTVSEVCYNVGFSNPSYFSAAFKEFFGISPLEASQA